LGQAKAEEESAKSNPVARREAPNLNAMTTPRTGMLPPAGTIGSGNDLEARPLSPEIKLEVQPESPPRSIRNSISDDPAPVADTPSKPAEERPGVIEITPSKGTNAASSSQGDADMFRKIARDQFLAGRYQQAADSYLKALKAGAPAGMVYQRLGQCYEKLGRTADAVSSYRKAIAALSAGGASAANQAAIEACEQAIRALGG
jgi:tetratricopeptide (TPR) repeat protein